MLIYKRILLLLFIVIFSGCSVTNKSMCYDQFGNSVDTDDVKDGLINVEGYVYATISNGKLFDSQNDPEVFSKGVIDFNVADKDSYFKLSVNDEIRIKDSSISLKNAQTSYEFNTVDNSVCIVRSQALFEGKISLKGYITLDIDDTVLFYPANGEWNGLPMLWYETKAAFSNDEIEIISNAPRISLGHTDDYKNDELMVKADNSLCEVYITIDNLALCWKDGDYGASVNSAGIIDISYL